MELLHSKNVKVDKATSPIKFENISENVLVNTNSTVLTSNYSQSSKKNHSFIIKSFTNTGIQNLNIQNERDKIKFNIDSLVIEYVRKEKKIIIKAHSFEQRKNQFHSRYRCINYTECKSTYSARFLFISDTLQLLTSYECKHQI